MKGIEATNFWSDKIEYYSKPFAQIFLNRVGAKATVMASSSCDCGVASCEIDTSSCAPVSCSGGSSECGCTSTSCDVSCASCSCGV